MKIALVASELTSLTGDGLQGKSVEDLAKGLEKSGESVVIFLPRYGWLGKRQANVTTVIRRIRLRIGKGTKEFNIYQANLADSAIPVYLIDKDLYFKRAGVYGENNHEYPDNAERFHYFSLAVLESLKVLDYQPDVLHCHDAVTAAIPVYLDQVLSSHEFYRPISSVFSVHNPTQKGEISIDKAVAIGLDLVYSKIPTQPNGNYSFLEEGKRCATTLVENLSDIASVQKAYRSANKELVQH